MRRRLARHRQRIGHPHHQRLRPLEDRDAPPRHRDPEPPRRARRSPPPARPRPRRSPPPPARPPGTAPAPAPRPAPPAPRPRLQPHRPRQRRPEREPGQRPLRVQPPPRRQRRHRQRLRRGRPRPRSAPRGRRSISPVSTRPAAKSSCRTSRARNPRFVVHPATRVASSACASFPSATARVGPCAITLAIIGSYQGEIASPARTPESTRTPSGNARCVSRADRRQEPLRRILGVEPRLHRVARAAPAPPAAAAAAPPPPPGAATPPGPPPSPPRSPDAPPAAACSSP